jgi:FixJ family two-component response regulator
LESLTSGEIVVIDDDRATRTALLRLLRAAGYEARGLEDAASYLACAGGGNRAACLVVAVRMPGLSGLELQERLAASPAPPPLILVTGQGAADVRQEGHLKDSIQVLEKPLSAQKLLAALARATDAARIA